MTIDVKIPSPGESISEVELATWFVEDGEYVKKNQEIGEIESEKATLPLIAEKSGKVELIADVGTTLKVGEVACKIDTSAEDTSPKEKEGKSKQEETGKESQEMDEGEKAESGKKDKDSDEKKVEKNQEDAGKEKKLKDSSKKSSANNNKDQSTPPSSASDAKSTPVARKMMEEEGFSIDDIVNGLKKITSTEVNAVKEAGLQAGGTPGLKKKDASRNESRNKMSQLRKKISERLVSVKNETAMLTTFNEADMSAVMNLRKKYQDKFIQKHDVKLGFMSFFTKAVTTALQQFPNVNSYLNGDEIVTPEFCDVGIAVQTEKGLMVPIIRNTETLGLADIEKEIMDIAGRARKNRISMDELSGGTFTITNGGIFGSMLSTPILNPPQSAILGMHNIIDRPVAVNGKVEIRPMMYIALSYDHRVIDGRDSVSFLKTVKEYIENPSAMLFGNIDPEAELLEL